MPDCLSLAGAHSPPFYIHKRGNIEAVSIDYLCENVSLPYSLVKVKIILSSWFRVYFKCLNRLNPHTALGVTALVLRKRSFPACHCHIERSSIPSQKIIVL